MQLLQKYKGLVFHDLDSGNGFCIYDQNMEFRRGRGNGWFVLGVCSTNSVEDEGFLFEIACDLIGSTPQKEGMCVLASGSRGSVVITRYQSLPLTPSKVLPICVTQ
jgi:hypothetical protein